MGWTAAYVVLGILFAVSFYAWLTRTPATEYREEYPENWWDGQGL